MPFGQKRGPDQVTTVTPNLTPAQQSWLDSIQGSIGATPPGMTAGEGTAQDYWTNLVQQAGLASRGLTGDQNAFQSFAAPGLDQLRPMFDRMRAADLSRAGLATTSPFGIGARSGIDLAQSQMQGNELEAGYTYQNSQDALNRMLSFIGGPGMGAAGALQSAGMFNRMLPMEWAQGRLGLLGPTGTTQRTPTQSNWLGTALGIGSMIAAPFTGGASLAATPGLLNEGSQPAGPAGGAWDPSTFGAEGGPSEYAGGAAWDPSQFGFGFGAPAPQPYGYGR